MGPTVASANIHETLGSSHFWYPFTFFFFVYRLLNGAYSSKQLLNRISMIIKSNYLLALESTLNPLLEVQLLLNLYSLHMLLFLTCQSCAWRKEDICFDFFAYLGWSSWQDSCKKCSQATYTSVQSTLSKKLLKNYSSLIFFSVQNICILVQRWSSKWSTAIMPK